MTSLTGEGQLGGGERLRGAKEQIVSDWMRRVRRDVAGARSLEYATLRDSLPEYLEGLATALDTRSAEPALLLELSRLHAEQRSQLDIYTVEDVLREYRLLRATILDVMEAHGGLGAGERELLHQAIDAGIGQAGAAFMRVQLDRCVGNVRDLERERAQRSEFVSTMTHDLRNPLSAARLALQRLLHDSIFPNSLRAPALKAVANIDRVDAMIQDLLDANRVRVGARLPLTVEPCELGQIVREVIEDLTARYGDRFVFAVASPIRGHWSRSGLRRVVENLCTNAIKYGRTDAPILLSLAVAGDKASLAVHNDGDALTPEEQRRMFEPFHRSPAAEASGKRGWGLGLTLVRGVCDAHGGGVEVRSGPERGVTFVVTLPCDARPFQTQ